MSAAGSHSRGDGWTYVLEDAELKAGEPQRVFLGEQMIMLVRQGQKVFATDALCPHKYGALPDGELGDGCITCPIHDATFDLQSGEPGQGQEWAGRLPVYAARVEDGKVLVLLP